ncbi:hypothetical protein [[Mycobacterium] nativiensis]|uniref:Uncharacterized protein n=1 Tax=[Mycobacterium] nativiensis TaxID=2855503 RepID=A0ABU5XZF3_9MYCO|nr:hypothetical protein [Mycolicibacter sp. MYC340]MEB3033218.1 hypothetical protein [Mycolicibacter sp. MYC340]
MTILYNRTRTIRPIFSDVPPVIAVAPPEPPPREWTWLNWGLSLLVAPAAALTMAFALARAAGTALCATAGCPNPEMNGLVFGLLFYGPAAVAALTLILAFFFATYRAGIAVWAGGFAMVLADLAVLAWVF